MSSGMLREEIPVYSELHDIHGVVRDYGFVMKLFFTYDGREIVMGISRDPFGQKSFAQTGAALIDSYVEELHAGNRRMQLHWWYIDEQEADGVTYRVGHGIVTGHRRIPDSAKMHTSAVQAVRIDEEAGEAVLFTRNSVYHCPLAYCRFKKQDAFPDFLPDYENLKARYSGTMKRPQIAPGKVLLVLADFCEYYFHSVWYVPEKPAPDVPEDADHGPANSVTPAVPALGEPLPFTGYPHIGTFRDSYLIEVEGTGIDLRYFPHFQNIEFYAERTEGRPLYLENIGGTVLYARTSCGQIRLEPGERKEVSRENAEEESPALPDGDLYPAGIIE